MEREGVKRVKMGRDGFKGWGWPWGGRGLKGGDGVGGG